MGLVGRHCPGSGHYDVSRDSYTVSGSGANLMAHKALKAHTSTQSAQRALEAHTSTHTAHPASFTFPRRLRLVSQIKAFRHVPV
jgi:hypothetical protein